MEEIWKYIEGCKDCYEVSNLGNIRSLGHMVLYKNGRKRYFPGQQLKPSYDSDGYCIVTIRRFGKRITQKVHRLVAECFIPNQYNLPCVNHIDENKSNNSVLNLEWCDRAYNDNYGTRNSRMAASKKGKQFTEEHCRNISRARKEMFAKRNGATLR